MKLIFKAGFAVSVLSVMTLVLAAASNPKATGDVRWKNTSAGTEAHVVFNAIATSAQGTDAKGSLLYDDGTYVYTMDVKYLKVEGNKARFAGVVTASPGDQKCCAVGTWIFYTVEDNGEPGIGDFIWGQELPGVIDSEEARDKVKGVDYPIGGPFPIIGGNLQVHK
jgi:hypothetical protein